MPANGAVGGAAYNQKKHELLLELLEELKEEQVAIGHAGGDGMSLADVRWDLERVAMGQQTSVLLLAAADEAALEAALQAAPGWRSVDGGWQIEDEASGDRIQTKWLQERREAAAAPVLGTRKLGALTHLLRDPAYELASLPHKLQQLAHLCAAELQGLDEPRTSLSVPYLSADSAHPLAPSTAARGPSRTTRSHAA